jgi:hypothetical protein
VDASVVPLSGGSAGRLNYARSSGRVRKRSSSLYVAIKHFIAGLFDARVDVVTRDCLKKPYVQPAATRDAIYAF